MKYFNTVTFSWQGGNFKSGFGYSIFACNKKKIYVRIFEAYGLLFFVKCLI